MMIGDVYPHHLAAPTKMPTLSDRGGHLALQCYPWVTLWPTHAHKGYIMITHRIQGEGQIYTTNYGQQSAYELCLRMAHKAIGSRHHPLEPEELASLTWMKLQRFPWVEGKGASPTTWIYRMAAGLLSHAHDAAWRHERKFAQNPATPHDNPWYEAYSTRHVTRPDEGIMYRATIDEAIEVITRMPDDGCRQMRARRRQLDVLFRAQRDGPVAHHPGILGHGQQAEELRYAIVAAV